MEPTILLTISASAAVGAALGWVGGRKTAANPDLELDEADVSPRVDPRVDELDQENSFLRRLAGLQDVERLRRTFELMGETREPLQRRLADIHSARGVRQAGFFDEQALLIAGDASDPETTDLGHFLASVRPPTRWRRIEWRGMDGESRVIEAFALGKRQVSLAVRARGPLPDSALSRTRYAFDGISAVPTGSRLAPVEGRQADLRGVGGMADSGLFLGITVIGPQGGIVESVGVPPPEGSLATWRALVRHTAITPEHPDTLSYAWSDLSGERYSILPFEANGGRGVVFAITDDAREFPEERSRRWVRQIARELAERTGE